MAMNRVPRSVNSSLPTVLDYLGMAWVVHEAYPTPHGFEVYKGYAQVKVGSHPRMCYIKTDALVHYLRATRPKDIQLPISRGIIYKIRAELGLAIGRAPIDHSFRWTQAGLDLLGTIADGDLGSILGTSLSVVRGKRVQLGIAPFEFWTPAMLALLGTRPDRELAQMINQTFSAVAKKRDRLKIPAFNNRQRRGKKRLPFVIDDKSAP
jgi:hypothetical protein